MSEQDQINLNELKIVFPIIIVFFVLSILIS
ncbi:Uncharacterised protein [Staphylococcus gallinarum]|nr:Uncharacterised protein [Staphylococcus gallinarum]